MPLPTRFAVTVHSMSLEIIQRFQSYVSIAIDMKNRSAPRLAFQHAFRWDVFYETRVLQAPRPPPHRISFVLTNRENKF